MKTFTLKATLAFAAAFSLAVWSGSFAQERPADAGRGNGTETQRRAKLLFYPIPLSVSETVMRLRQ